MRSALLGLAVILALSGSAADPAVIQYDSFGFLRFPPQIVIGEAAGVAVTQARVYVLSRGNVSGPAAGAAAAQLLEFELSLTERVADRIEQLEDLPSPAVNAL